MDGARQVSVIHFSLVLCLNQRSLKSKSDRLQSSITGLMDSDKETGFFTKSAGNNEGNRKKPGFWATS
ncbi:MAG: hypothetical protein WBL95_03505 [Microcoleus sp.]